MGGRKVCGACFCLYDDDGMCGCDDSPITPYGTANDADTRQELARLQQFLNDCGKLLTDTPGLPLETASHDDLSKWTDIIGSLCIVLNDYIGTPRKQA